jgi:hypothetical protein
VERVQCEARRGRAAERAGLIAEFDAGSVEATLDAMAAAILEYRLALNQIAAAVRLCARWQGFQTY